LHNLAKRATNDLSKLPRHLNQGLARLLLGALWQQWQAAGPVELHTRSACCGCCCGCGEPAQMALAAAAAAVVAAQGAIAAAGLLEQVVAQGHAKGHHGVLLLAPKTDL
jgi:hypothetical protein